MDKLKLLMGRKIPFKSEEGLFVHQPLISEVVEMGEESFNDLVYPFVLTSEAVFNGQDNDGELSAKYPIYQLYFATMGEDEYILDGVFGGKSALDSLKESISYFLNVDAKDIQFLTQRKKIVIGEYVIDEQDFVALRKIIQLVVSREDISVEKVPKNMSERQRDIWEKLQRGRRNTARRDALYLQDMINVVSFGGSTYIPLDQIEKMTYYQLRNAYKSVMSMDAYKLGMDYKLSPKYEVKDDVEHWTKSLRIGM